MDFELHQDPEELDSTGYIEIGPGRYSGQHWRKGFLFVHEGAFTFAEGILRKHHQDFDHFAMNDIPRTEGLQIVEDWRRAARAIQDQPSEGAIDRLLLGERLNSHLAPEFRIHRLDISNMLEGLATAVASYYKEEEWACVLGV